MPRAIFFDLDDTLLNTSGGVEASWKLVSEEFAPRLGAEPAHLHEIVRKQQMEFWKDEAAVGAYWRTRLHEARIMNVARAFEANGLDAALAREYSDRYWEEVSGRYHLFDDAHETLHRLRDGGFRLGLITNGPQEMQRWKIARFEVEQHFDVIVIEGEFGAGKPDRRVFEHALRSTGTDPQDAWHVGDNLYADIGGAQAVGIHGVWIHRERLERKDGAEAMPDRVIGHLPELQEALGVA